MAVRRGHTDNSQPLGDQENARARATEQMRSSERARSGSPSRAEGQERSGQRDARAATPSRRQSQQAAGVFQRVPLAAIVVAAVVLLGVILFAGRLCSQAASITVSVNGTSYTLRGDKNLEVAIKESGLPVNPGDFISLQGNIIERSAGYPFYATVNGKETVDPQYRLHEGDVITLTDGHDRVEEYDVEESPVPYGMRITSLGSIHTFVAGTDGVLETRTGRTTGEVIEKQTVDPEDAHENRADPDTKGEKIIALTFDGGPSTKYTREILEILAQNDAKATFFCVGAYVVDEGVDVVREAAEQGHQICTHSYDDAKLGNTDMNALSAEEQRSQVTDGYAALANALGYEPSHVVRLGVTDMSEWVALNVFDLIDAEAGWTVDTGDWIYMEEDDIYDVLMSVQPGSIVRMHDGGGDQSTTVAALKRALPKLAKEGYSFVTIDEIMKYT